MADFSSDLSEFKSSFPILDIDPNMESISHQNLLMDNSDLINFHTSMPFYCDSFSNHQTQLAEFPGIFPENFPPNFLQNNQNIVPLSFHHHPLSVPGVESESKKRKALDVSDCSSMNSSPQVSDNGKGKNISRRGKKAKGKEQEEKPKEVVHVRARRGQATDSHSLAERVRRGKINERLRCLQDIVPGCYKTMGMAVMLDEIINYVQSLQNQVEFLSMKLTAASTFYNFNSETDVIETMQIIKAEEAKENKHTKH